MPAIHKQLRQPIAVTDGLSNDQLLYFTSHSLSADGRMIVVISDRDGDVNLHAIDLLSGNRRALTKNRDGYLRSYVYFDGEDRKGVGKASVSFDAKRGIIYYIEGESIRSVTLEGEQNTFANIGQVEVTAFTHVSDDGRLLCVPTTQSRALEGPLTAEGRPAHNIDQRVQDENLCSWLNVYDTSNGKQVLRERVERGWVTHVQFSPTNPAHILYNHEWSGDRGLRRMWLFDGKTHRTLRPMTEGRVKADWACHEIWSPDGQAVIYHGGYANNGPTYIGRITLDGLCTEIALPDSYRGYGHFTLGCDGRLVTDGYFRFDDDPTKSSKYIVTLRPDWHARTIEWQPLCEHGSSWNSQDEHPHPIFDHTARSVLFTSDVTGKRAVYKVAA